MDPVLGSGFAKKRHCPSSYVLASYDQRNLPLEQLSEVATHLAGCDFCAAELQLLSRFATATESCEAPEMPVHLRALAAALLFMNGAEGRGGLRKAEVHERPV
jgi:hypothetical protein